MLAAALGRPLRFILTGGQVQDIVTPRRFLRALLARALSPTRAYAGKYLR
jgi:hypothetical protein